MKHLLKVTGEITSADYERILLSEDGSVISQLGGGGKPIEYEAVDLGLHSKLKWCNMNVGASSPEDAGLYFQWGDTQGYTADQVGVDKQFSNDDYTYTDNPDTLPLDNDAAHVNMGGSWRMPTKEEINELIEYTNNKWVNDYNGTGISGSLFTSKVNGNSIFVPAAGYAYDGSVSQVGYYGGFRWSSSLYESNADHAWYLYFSPGIANAASYLNRYYGFPVRAVLAQ